MHLIDWCARATDLRTQFIGARDMVRAEHRLRQFDPIDLIG